MCVCVFLGNFKNVPKTVALRYQLQSFWHWSKETDVITPPTHYQHKKGVFDSVSYKGTTYQRGMAVCQGIDSTGIPEVLAIEEIKEGPLLVCRPLQLTYNSHFRSYLIDDTRPCSSNVTVPVNGLANSFPIDILVADNDKYLSIRCALI